MTGVTGVTGVTGGRRPTRAVPLATAATAGVLALALGAMRWLHAVVSVRGPSMEPEICDGDRLLARRCGIGQLRPGQIVIFSEPGLPQRRQPAWLTGAGRRLWVIKRVAAIPGDPVPDAVRPAVGGASVVPPRAIVVLGDGPQSRDSRQWGFVAARHIFGVGVRRLPQGDCPEDGPER
jgi:signal peptidase I